MDPKKHWERIYSEKPETALGWYTPHLRTSLDMIASCPNQKNPAIIDVGGGASTLVDDLVDAGFTNVTVLDLSAPALRNARRRLADKASLVTWMEGDITDVELEAQAFDIWHDRAVLHFLLDPEDRRAYVSALRQAIRPGGCVIIGAFSPAAPPRCSGLEVRRYTPETLHQELGSDFKLQDTRYDDHVTPSGVKQRYVYCRFEAPA